MQKDNEKALYKECKPLIDKVASISVNCIYKISPKYLDEIKSICNFAFAKALNSYDESHDVKFSTYFVNIAKRDIDKFVKKLFAEQNNESKTAYDEMLERYTSTEKIKEVQVVEDSESDIEKYVKSLFSSSNATIAYGARALMLEADGYSHKEIAELLGISTTNVGSVLSRTKKYIREHYDLCA